MSGFWSFAKFLSAGFAILGGFLMFCGIHSSKHVLRLFVNIECDGSGNFNFYSSLADLMMLYNIGSPFLNRMCFPRRDRFN